MSNLDYKPEYQKKLPHIQPPGATFFITYRLAGSLPVQIIRQLMEELDQLKRAALTDNLPPEQADALYREQRRAFGRFDTALDRADTGPNWLNRPEIAQQIMDSLFFLNGELFLLDTFCVMSNHVHVVFTPLENEDKPIALSRILHAHKRYTAVEANKMLGLRGKFWEHESYDHVVRDDEELLRIRKYVMNNPVKVGLIDDAADWPYSWASWLAGDPVG